MLMGYDVAVAASLVGSGSTNCITVGCRALQAFVHTPHQLQERLEGAQKALTKVVESALQGSKAIAAAANEFKSTSAEDNGAFIGLRKACVGALCSGAVLHLTDFKLSHYAQESSTSSGNDIQFADEQEAVAHGLHIVSAVLSAISPAAAPNEKFTADVKDSLIEEATTAASTHLHKVRTIASSRVTFFDANVTAPLAPIVGGNTAQAGSQRNTEVRCPPQKWLQSNAYVQTCTNGIESDKVRIGLALDATQTSAALRASQFSRLNPFAGDSDRPQFHSAAIRSEFHQWQLSMALVGVVASRCVNAENVPG